MKKILVKTLFVLAYSFEKVKGHSQVGFFFTIECFANYLKAFSTIITYIQLHSVSSSYWGSESFRCIFKRFCFHHLQNSISKIKRILFTDSFVIRSAIK